MASQLRPIDLLVSHLSNFIIIQNRDGSIDIEDLLKKINDIEKLAKAALAETNKLTKEHEKAITEARKLTDSLLEYKTRAILEQTGGMK